MSVVALSAIETGRRCVRTARMRAMALNAPTHRQRRLLLDTLHPLDVSVTRLASDAGDYVLAVIEVNEVRQVVNLRPRNRPGDCDELLQLLDFRRLLLKYAVAIHAHVRGRNAGVAARWRAEGTIEAWNARVAGGQL